jgi:wyosine [tRNA(Phe)-imidazoG37] synthetase (radical SAM superfamily)
MAKTDSSYSNGEVTGLSRMAVAPECDAAFAQPRDLLNNQFVYLVISSRAGGLSVNVNLNPVMKCNFSCAYCEVDRGQAPRAARLDIDGMAKELCDTVNMINSGELRTRAPYDKLPPQLLKMQHVALSGDGEPTLAPLFVEAMQEIIHIRAVHRVPYFKIVLLTNSSALDHQEVLDNIKLLTSEDEIWAKLDAGSQEYFSRVNASALPLEHVCANILGLARQRPVVIQSLFSEIDGVEPSTEEIRAYANRLKEMKEGGARIPLVQVFSADRPMARSGCARLSLKGLSRIAATVRKVTGLRAEVF